MAVYVCSDVHGQGKLFHKMLETIGFSKDDTLYVLGDLIDRGPDSVDLLKFVIEHRDNIHCLMGNHELMMVIHYDRNAYGCRYFDDYWMNPSNSGYETMQEIDALSDSEKKDIIDFVKNLAVQKEIQMDDKIFLLSHSSFLPDEKDVDAVDMDYDRLFDVVWNSPWRFWEHESLSTYAFDGRWHIIGHVPVHRIDNWRRSAAYVDEQHHLINIDLGCASMESGIVNDAALCCMRLDAFVSGEDSFIYFRPDKETSSV